MLKSERVIQYGIFLGLWNNGPIFEMVLIPRGLKWRSTVHVFQLFCQAPSREYKLSIEKKYCLFSLDLTFFHMWLQCVLQGHLC